MTQVEADAKRLCWLRDASLTPVQEIRHAGSFSDAMPEL